MITLAKRLVTDPVFALKVFALLGAAAVAAVGTLDPHDQTVQAVLAGAAALGLGGHAARS